MERETDWEGWGMTVSAIAGRADGPILDWRRAGDEDQAEQALARLRWPDGPVCPFCNGVDAYALNLRTVKRRRYKCRACRRQFSVTKGTILEGSKLPLGAWIRLIHILCERDGDPLVSEVSRELAVSYDAVRNALDRLTYAAKREPLSSILQGRGPI